VAPENAGAENALRRGDQSQIIQDVFIRVLPLALAGYRPALLEAARLLLAGGVRG
jgi:hypothetical protein